MLLNFQFSKINEKFFLTYYGTFFFFKKNTYFCECTSTAFYDVSIDCQVDMDGIVNVHKAYTLLDFL